MLRYRIVDREPHYLESEESLALCAAEKDVPLMLQKAHDKCGHFAMAITNDRLRRRQW
jgi:hypothetical protein